MKPCCPAGRGCNSPRGDEPCALDLCRAAAEQERDAALALAYWNELERLPEQGAGSERRFRRRAFERARDRALRALAMRLDPAMLTRKHAVQTAHVRRRQPVTRRRRPVRRARVQPGPPPPTPPH